MLSFNVLGTFWGYTNSPRTNLAMPTRVTNLLVQVKALLGHKIHITFITNKRRIKKLRINTAITKGNGRNIYCSCAGIKAFTEMTHVFINCTDMAIILTKTFFTVEANLPVFAKKGFKICDQNNVV